jgi:hypothetical protein
VRATESLRLTELRSSRRALRAERARVSYWRRLVTARLDLALACVAPPDQLGVDLTLLLDGAVHTALPAHADLARALLHSLPITEIHHLDELYRLDERLAAYQRDDHLEVHRPPHPRPAGGAHGAARSTTAQVMRQTVTDSRCCSRR